MSSVKQALRKKYELPIDAWIIGSFQRDTEGVGIDSGNFVPKLEKGPDLFCDFVNDVSQRTKNTHVLLAGWRRQYVIRRLESAGIGYTYFEKPSIDVINELYQCIDMYAVSARYEGGPQALIECGLLNVPVVSTPVGMADQVLPEEAINKNLGLAKPRVPNVEALKLPGGYSPFRELIKSL